MTCADGGVRAHDVQYLVRTVDVAVAVDEEDQPFRGPLAKDPVTEDLGLPGAKGHDHVVARAVSDHGPAHSDVTSECARGDHDPSPPAAPLHSCRAKRPRRPSAPFWPFTAFATRRLHAQQENPWPVNP